MVKRRPFPPLYLVHTGNISRVFLTDRGGACSGVKLAECRPQKGVPACALALTDVEVPEATVALLAHLHGLAVHRRRADVPAGVAGGREGAEVSPGVLLVEEEAHVLALLTDGGQAAVVLHLLRSQSINVRALKEPAESTCLTPRPYLQEQGGLVSILVAGQVEFGVLDAQSHRSGLRSAVAVEVSGHVQLN